jgi:hypothetical protein
VVNDAAHRLEFLTEATSANTMLIDTLDDRTTLGALVKFLLRIFHECICLDATRRPVSFSGSETHRKDEIEFFLQKKSCR